MTAPTLQPLAALLALHPEECAAVVAALSSYDSANTLVIADTLRIDQIPIQVERVEEIVDALMLADLCIRGSEGRHWIYALQRGERRAIARMGAAAWLAQRCPPAPSSPSFDDREQASRDRLCDIHAMAVHYKHPTARAIRSILIGAGNGVPVNCDKYRGLLVRIGAYGVPLDVDAEVAAVWGEQAK